MLKIIIIKYIVLGATIALFNLLNHCFFKYSVPSVLYAGFITGYTCAVISDCFEGLERKVKGNQ